MRHFLDQLMRSTNMSCLTPDASLSGDCQFLSANLYARSVFGMFGIQSLLSPSFFPQNRLRCLRPMILSFFDEEVRLLTLCFTNDRRGRISKPQHRKRRRGRTDHGLCEDQESISRFGIESGVAKGAQGWHELRKVKFCPEESK